MSETKHTPGPWKARILRSPGYHPTIDILADKKPPVVGWLGFDDCDTPDGEHEANAAYIVRAVNCHDELVSVLEYVCECLEAGSMGQDRLLVKKMRAALIKAEGE
jgi:hypothetical protein